MGNSIMIKVHDKLAEKACLYAVLVLHDDNIEVSANNIGNLLKAANIKAQPCWSMKYAKFILRKSVDDLITKIGGMDCVLTSHTSSTTTILDTSCKIKEEKKPDSEPEEDIGLSLFD